MMKKSKSRSADKVTELILDFSAEAQTKRREVAEDSSAFHNFMRAIVAYGKTLDLLSKLQQLQEEQFSDWVRIQSYSQQTGILPEDSALN